MPSIVLVSDLLALLFKSISVCQAPTSLLDFTLTDTTMASVRAFNITNNRYVRSTYTSQIISLDGTKGNCDNLLDAYYRSVKAGIYKGASHSTRQARHHT
ncbi:hypothetical protein GGR54DRAFT_601378 [Hypoxylon sp. NC1633]|nr:hypothetical protein GGR54DRAFT_601378 [Hypoxylon sp. NC1633]